MTYRLICILASMNKIQYKLFFIAGHNNDQNLTNKTLLQDIGCFSKSKPFYLTKSNTYLYIITD